MIYYQKEDQISSFEVLDIFSIISQLLPFDSKEYSLYLYHLRALAMILDRVECGEDLTSTKQLLTNIGANLPIS